MNRFRTIAAIAPAVAGITLRSRAGTAILPSMAGLGIDKTAACAMAALQRVHHGHRLVRDDLDYAMARSSTLDDACRRNDRDGQSTAAHPGSSTARRVLPGVGFMGAPRRKGKGLDPAGAAGMTTLAQSGTGAPA